MTDLNISSELDSQDLQILKVLQSYPKQKMPNTKDIHSMSNQINKLEQKIDKQLFLTDAILIMFAKEIQYVETLTGFKNGFLFNDKKINIFTDNPTNQLIPNQYKDLWRVIQTGNSKKCQNLRKFFYKMLSSKNVMIAKQCFLIYFQCLQYILFLEEKQQGKLLQQFTLVQNAKDFSNYLYKTIFEEASDGSLIFINQNYQNVALANQSIPIKQLFEFQSNFKHDYGKFKGEFLHFIQIIYYCLEMQFYSIKATQLYQGYFRNTQLQTIRGVPKPKQEKIHL